MKVISGSLKGRTIKGYDLDGTRPTMDRVKESLFASIQNHVKNSVVLDLFAGSGNLGIEAISNGARECYFNDCSKDAFKIIKENINNFDIGNCSSIMRLDYMECLKLMSKKSIKFNLIFLDPPYKMEVLNEVISYILDHKLISNDGLIICEVGHNYLNAYAELENIKIKKYGDKLVIIFKNNN